MEKGLNRMKLRHIKRRKRLLAITAILILLLFLPTMCRKLNSGTVSVTIPEGAPAERIAQILKDSDVIGSKTWFLLRLNLSEYSGKLRYGTFKLDKNSSLGEIFKTLTTKGAQQDTVKLTIPEGFSAERIKQRVCEMGLCTENEFEEALKADYDFAFLDTVPHSKDINYRLQGFLYPSTYEFYANATARTIIETMLKEFEKQVSPLNIPQDKLYEIITKASMVEREAKIASERPIIAGVFENRLKADMLLQIDATVVYAISDGLYDVERVYYKDLETASKYNTYKYKGLPIGPICSPSISSIKAANNPLEHEYLYYHTDNTKNDGSHIFTKTFSEHTATMN